MIDVVLPVLDEAEALPHVLRAFPAGFRPLVVDNGSSDGSADVARAHGARVVEEPVKGFGSACFAGLTAADTELVCFMDADGSLDPGELPRVVAPVQSGAAKLALGARRPSSKDAQSPHQKVANRVLAAELRRRSGVAMSDLGPMRCGRRDDLLALGIEDRRFGWPLEMVLRASAAGWPIEEVPVTYGTRKGGRSKVTGTVGGTARTIRDMLRVLREVDRRVSGDQAA